MPVTWNVYHGGDASVADLVYDCLKFGAVSNATTEAVTIAFNDLSIVFEGDVNLNGGGDPSSGMFNALHIYNGDTLVAEATGYWLDLDVIGDTADDLQAGSASIMQVFELLGMQRITFNGSEDDDFYIDGGQAGTYYGNGGNDTLLGMGGNDTINGGDGDDIMHGGNDADALRGGDGNDDMLGGHHDDDLRGNAGDDKLRGGGGEDVLNGGSGADDFYFEWDHAFGEVDTITSFSGADEIYLENGLFAGIGGPGVLAAGKFYVGSNAHDANDRIIYKANTGALYYDADGDGAGAKVKFAVLENKPDLSAADIMVF